MKAISRRVGHTSIGTTMDLYGHLMPDAEDAGLDRLDVAARHSSGITGEESSGSVIHALADHAADLG